MKNFTCDICGQLCGTKSQLNKHIIRVHEKLKDFKCDICNKVFGYKDVLSKHILNRHVKKRRGHVKIEKTE